MKVLLFSKDPCPACDRVRAKLNEENVEIEEIKHPGRMAQLVGALPDVRAMPVLLVYSCGDGQLTDQLIKRVHG